MDILIISAGDACRSRMAQELLNSFGRGMKITTSGVTVHDFIPETVIAAMQENGHEISTKAPAQLDAYLDRKWDYAVTLCPEAEEALSSSGLKAEHVMHFNFEDPLTGSTEDQKQQISDLYDKMFREIYKFYRDEIRDGLMPTCTCGANTYCHCN